MLFRSCVEIAHGGDQANCCPAIANIAQYFPQFMLMGDGAHGNSRVGPLVEAVFFGWKCLVLNSVHVGLDRTGYTVTRSCQKVPDEFWGDWRNP